MMLYKKANAMVHSTDRDIDFFDIVTEVFQRDILTSYLFILCLDYFLWTLIDLTQKIASN